MFWFYTLNVITFSHLGNCDLFFPAADFPTVFCSSHSTFFLSFSVLRPLHVYLHSFIAALTWDKNNNSFKAQVIVFSQSELFWCNAFLLVLFYSVIRKRKVHKMEAVSHWLFVGDCSHWDWYAIENRTNCYFAA